MGVQKGKKKKAKQNSEMNKLTDGDLIQFAFSPPEYPGLHTPNNGDWEWGRVPTVERMMGQSPDPLPHPAPISLWKLDGYSCFKAPLPWADPEFIFGSREKGGWDK